MSRLPDLAAGAEPGKPNGDPLLLQEVHPLLIVDRSWRGRERSRTPRNGPDKREPGWNVILVAITNERQTSTRRGAVSREGRNESRTGNFLPKPNWLELVFLTRDLEKEAYR
jgi:hypothetical protein